MSADNSDSFFTETHWNNTFTTDNIIYTTICPSFQDCLRITYPNWPDIPVKREGTDNVEYYYYDWGTHYGKKANPISDSEISKLVEKLLNKAEKEEKQFQEKEAKEPMETLFNVIVVTKRREILADEKVVAKDEEEAKFSVDIYSLLKDCNLKPKDVTIICDEIGDVKIKKEVQKVKIADEGEE